ncbi:MAG: SMC-Scp complex subunit ScpB [Clostridia bacterium]|nr:SMC-Scp complex subunit ScpB [Clostridia bacterium]
MENLENILESILFASGESVDIGDITSKIDVTKADINKAVKKLQEKYDGKSGIKLLQFNNKLQFASNGDYAEQVSLVLNPIRQRNLSKATLETASIIAYKQPITRLEIEEIRGVSSDYAINILLEHNLIEVVGRKDAIGKPLLFGTTDEFLKRFNLESIDQLPDYNELLERVKVIKKSDDRLYNHFEVKGDNDEKEAAADLQINQNLSNDNLNALADKVAMTKVKTLDLDTFGPVIGEKDADFDAEDTDFAEKSSREEDETSDEKDDNLLENLNNNDDLNDDKEDDELDDMILDEEISDDDFGDDGFV